ncbi:type 1 phosphatidylinositol 4,5-bisphosphate 4-phosphatase-like [Hoplias malabaricus]|uniref:type 1 phosphatidylinositol 4,5-bisphosphate 4-phosphatase-like n=1 Tax=Hoplias malabaricus TaxID=27720 RepID=UPI0034619749
MMMYCFDVPSHPPSQDALPGYEASPGHEASPNQDDPPPYSAVAGDGSLSLSCSVCGALISVKSESTQRIVKCGVCQEATPIKSPPAGKMFVRCSCNCLLICRASAQRVACPRPHCRRVIDLTGYGLSGTEWQYGGTRVSCGHCGQTFLGPPSTMKNQVRCPLCRKVSFIGREYPMRRCLYFIVVAIILAAFAGVLMPQLSKRKQKTREDNLGPPSGQASRSGYPPRIYPTVAL